MTTKRHYVYLHRRADTGEVFYVGKGFGKRAWKISTRSDWWKRIEAKHGRTVEIHADDLDENLAFELEAELIAKFGRTNLCNLTDGGEGGVNPSDETRAKMSAARFGIKFTESHIANMKKARSRQEITEATKLKISASLTGRKGRPMSDANKAAITLALRGKVRTPEHCAKISAAKKGKPGAKKSLEERAAISARMLSNVPSDEARRKIGDANRGRKHTDTALEKIKACNRASNIKARKAIKCSNGMTFEWSGAAEKWLRENGCPTAGRSNIAACANGKLKTAYGFSWSHAIQCQDV